MPVESLRRFHHRYRQFSLLKGLKTKKTVQAYTILILSLLTTSFFIVTAIRPTLKTIASLMAELRDKREIDEKLQEKINALSLAKANYQLIKKDLPLIEQALPSEAEFTLLMIQIENLAIQTNVSLDKENFEDISLIFSDELKIQFNLLVSGDYEDLKRFLAGLENLRRITVLQNFDVSKQRISEETEKAILELTLEAEIQSLGDYVRPETQS